MHLICINNRKSTQNPHKLNKENKNFVEPVIKVKHSQRPNIKCSSPQCPSAPQPTRVFMAFREYSGSCSAVLVLQTGSAGTRTIHERESNLRGAKPDCLYTHTRASDIKLLVRKQRRSEVLSHVFQNC